MGIDISLAELLKIKPKKLNYILIAVLLGEAFVIWSLLQQKESLKEVKDEKIFVRTERLQFMIEQEQKFYESKIDSLKKLMVLKEKRIQELLDQISKLEQQGKGSNKDKILRLRNEIYQLKEEIKTYKKELGFLRNENQIYKQTFELLKMPVDTLNKFFQIIQKRDLNRNDDSFIDEPLQKEINRNSKITNDKEKVKSQKVTKIKTDALSTSKGLEDRYLLEKKETKVPFDIKMKGSSDFAQYQVEIVDYDTVIVDPFNGLMWQKGGSQTVMRYPFVQKWIEELNQKGYAGYHDWRLPIKEEVMTLLKSKKINNLYIDPIFDKKQSAIWISNVTNIREIWAVNFVSGECRTLSYQHDCFVRAVRISN